MKTVELIATLAQFGWIFILYLVFRHYAGWSGLVSFIAAIPLGFVATWITMVTIGWVRSRRNHG